MRTSAVIVAFLASLFPTIISSGEPQKKPLPNLETCENDATAWAAEEDKGPMDKDIGYQLSFPELLKRQREMLGCLNYGSRLHPYERGLRVTHLYTLALMVRYQQFIHRNNLFEKFLEEDAKGMR
jgi:hypothetical protein